MNSPDILRPEPVHDVPDIGPVHRGDWLVVIASLLGTLGTLAACSLLSRNHLAYVWLPIIVFGIPSIWGWWCTLQSLRDKTPMPRSHSLLAGTLGFDFVCTSKKVAVTAFFFPDKIQAGTDTKLLIFLENYASRQRVVNIRILRHTGLGLPKKQNLRLHLTAGQAAVYEMPVRVAADISPGPHSLPVVIQVDMPAGQGRRLPGARKHLYDIRRFRYAAPFDVEPAPETKTTSPDTQTLPPPSYRTLASVDEPYPKVEVLQYFDRNEQRTAAG